MEKKRGIPADRLVENHPYLREMMDGILLLEVKKSTGFTRTNAADLAGRMMDIVVASLTAH